MTNRVRESSNIKTLYHVYGFDGIKRFGPHRFGIESYYDNKDEAIKIAKKISGNIKNYDVPSDTIIIVKRRDFNDKGICVFEEEVWGSVLGDMNEPGLIPDMEDFLRDEEEPESNLSERVASKANKFMEGVSDASLDEVVKRRQTDSEFKRKTDVKLKDLSPSCKYSFDEDLWEKNQELSLFELYKRASNSIPNNVTILLADNGKDMLGWIYVYVAPYTHDAIYGIKFGSFDPSNSKNNYEFFKQFIDYFKEQRKYYKEIHWVGSLEYPFIKHYIKIIKDNDGYITKGDNGFVAFHLSSTHNQEGHKSPDALYKEDLVDVNDNEQLKKKLEKTFASESFRGDHEEVDMEKRNPKKIKESKEFPGNDLHSRLCQFTYDTVDYFDLADAVGDYGDYSTQRDSIHAAIWDMSDEELIEGIKYGLEEGNLSYYGYPNLSLEDLENNAREDAKALVDEYNRKYTVRESKIKEGKEYIYKDKSGYCIARKIKDQKGSEDYADWQMEYFGPSKRARWVTSPLYAKKFKTEEKAWEYFKNNKDDDYYSKKEESKMKESEVEEKLIVPFYGGNVDEDYIYVTKVQLIDMDDDDTLESKVTDEDWQGDSDHDSHGNAISGRYFVGGDAEFEVTLHCKPTNETWTEIWVLTDVLVKVGVYYSDGSLYDSSWEWGESSEEINFKSRKTNPSNKTLEYYNKMMDDRLDNGWYLYEHVSEAVGVWEREIGNSREPYEKPVVFSSDKVNESKMREGKVRTLYHIYGFDGEKRFGPHNFKIEVFYDNKEEAISIAQNIAKNIDKYPVPTDTQMIVREEIYDKNDVCISSKQIWSSLIGSLNESVENDFKGLDFKPISVSYIRNKKVWNDGEQICGNVLFRLTFKYKPTGETWSEIWRARCCGDLDDSYGVSESDATDTKWTEVFEVNFEDYTDNVSDEVNDYYIANDEAIVYGAFSMIEDCVNNNCETVEYSTSID